MGVAFSTPATAERGAGRIGLIAGSAERLVRGIETATDADHGARQEQHQVLVEGCVDADIARGLTSSLIASRPSRIRDMRSR